MSLRLEREFGRCCRNQSLDCAHRAWQKGLERFCREEAAVKTGQHRCCQRLGGARSRCFAAAAPHPNYDRELYNVSLARPGPALLRSLCAPTRLLTKRRPGGRGRPPAAVGGTMQGRDPGVREPPNPEQGGTLPPP
ncbi:extracellular matrix protein 1 [Patagioenas fasciata monilis]|uniref:Extracellular matrix protein 1 n=1 Tax=Patagioenas fasciata monilis TaxID=372326 RepID=A0A1V4KMJ2_PATFA|nr:extracellular matrix protein 1 [Patagioenas fasciata monilis]